MDIEIKIGRDVDGGSVLRVPAEFKNVSRSHAVVKWHDGELSIKDNDSSNGTFVNGRRVASTRLKPTDKVFLGGTNPNDYCLNIQKLIDECQKLELKNKTDFSDEFEEIKQAYIDYQSEISELKKNSAMKSQLPMRLASMVPTLLGLGFMIWAKEAAWKAVGTILGLGISVALNIFLIGKSSKGDITEDITDIQIKYQSKYKCPKCGKEYNIAQMHWKKLEAGGACPYGCGAKFVK